MPRKKAIEIPSTGSESVTISIPRDPLSPRDRLVVDMLLELAAVRGALKADVVDSVVEVAERVSERLGWNV